jgi:hypothetical protein
VIPVPVHILQEGDKVTICELGRTEAKVFRLEGGELKELPKEPPAEEDHLDGG